MATTDTPAAAVVDDEPAPRRRWPWVVGTAVLVVLTAAAAVALLRPDEPLPGLVRTPPLDVAGIELVDYDRVEDGEVVDLVPDDGSISLLHFGYLSCPDVCPSTLATVNVALDDVPVADHARVEVGFVTVDPERDDGTDVRRYLDLFFDERTVATAALRADAGTPLDDVAEQLQVVYEIADHEPGAERYDVAHSAVTYVVDDTGTVVRELPFGTTADELARVIEAHLDG